MDAIPKPNRIVPKDGNAPNIAFPVSTFLQLIYWDMILATAVIKNATIGNAIHKTKLKAGIESFIWKRNRVIKRKKIDTGNADTKESATELCVSGLSITN